METLHKLAGVQDASDLQTSSNERPSQPQVVPSSPPPVPDKDTTEAQNSPHLTQRASRASLPLNRQPSHKSFSSSKSRSKSRAASPVGAPEDYPDVPALPGQHQKDTADVPPRLSQDTAGTATTGTEEDFAWGPTHPCFPHPNPHCLPTSEEYRTTRVIRVRRDWLQSGDLYPQYANLYPEILDPLVTDGEFRFLISNLNSRLKAAFDPHARRAWADGVMGVVTGWVWDDLGLTGAKRAEKSLEGFIEEWNRGKEREGREVRVVQLRRTGFMSLDFVVPDPGIDGVEGEEREGGIGAAVG
jgi:hypothetical protein